MVNKTDPKTKRKKIDYLFLTEVLFFFLFCFSKGFFVIDLAFQTRGGVSGV